jgi:hypothetical protein
MIPEIILQKALQKGFNEIRQDSRILNVLFKNYPVEHQEDIKKFLLENPIDLSLNYPKKELVLPAIVILLKTETESQTFLRDVMGAPPNYEMPEADVEDEAFGVGWHAGASTSGVEGLPKLLIQGLNVASQITPRSIVLTEDSQDIIDLYFANRSNYPCLKLYVTAGAGVGKVYRISSISSSKLDIVGTFEVDLDSTSVVDIRLAKNPEAPYGEPQRLYKPSTGLLRVGANYETQYQVDSVAGNQDQVHCLYAVVKAIFFTQKLFLEGQGIMALKIAGSDLAPRSELLPDEFFTRAMTLTFNYPFSMLTEQKVYDTIGITLVSDVEGSSYLDDIDIEVELELEEDV